MKWKKPNPKARIIPHPQFEITFIYFICDGTEVLVSVSPVSSLAKPMAGPMQHIF